MKTEIHTLNILSDGETWMNDTHAHLLTLKIEKGSEAAETLDNGVIPWDYLATSECEAQSSYRINTEFCDFIHRLTGDITLNGDTAAKIQEMLND